MKQIILVFLFIISIFPVVAQEIFNVEGTVMDNGGETLIGVSIVIKDRPGVGTTSDVDGKFNMKQVPRNSTLVFSSIGYKSKEIFVAQVPEKPLKIVLEEDASELDAVVIVGHGEQRKVSVVGSITSVMPDQLQSPTTSVTNMLGGRVPGIISVTRSGEPGNDFSEFWVRGISTFGANSSALVLIDGVEGNLNDLDPADIESFSILKDASATAVYGVRGANGVVIVTTHRGKAGKLNINLKSNVSLSYSPRMQEYLDAYDYARLANEAREVRGLAPRYDDTELRIIKYELDPDLYPNVNWRKEILKDYTLNNQHYLNISGGGTAARYFVSVGIQNKSAVFKTDESLNRYNTNVDWHKYTFRANVDANLTKTTLVSLGLDGIIVSQNAPGFGDNNKALWTSQVNMTPLTVPVSYSNGYMAAYGRNGDQMSPYVLLNHTGMKRESRNTTKINFSVKQDLDFITKGLKAGAQFAYTTNSSLRTERHKMPALYKAYGRYNDGNLMFERTVPETSASFVRNTLNNRKYYFESRINYERVFDNHRFGGLIHYYMQDYQTSEFNDEVLSIPERYQALSGRITYSFMDTYMIEGNVGYTGSENFKPGSQFGLFPAIALGWVPSQYNFVNQTMPFLNFFKIRASYGQVGNDRIASVRFPYMTYVNFNNVGYWGNSGLTEGQIGADNLQWEVAKKYNLGFDARMFKDKISFVVDVFKDIRENIFQARYLMPGEVGAVNAPYTNVGSMKSWGTDGNVTLTQEVSKDLTLIARGNMTYSMNEITHWDESVLNYEYQNKTGRPYNINRGLISLGLFSDSLQIASSPKQTFGEVRPGDIQYKDVNGDGKIDDNDIVPLSNSSVPRFQYGFAGEIRYKNWTFSIFFEGVSRVSYFLGGSGYYPFSGGETGNILSIVGDAGARWIPAWYSGDPSTENPNARFPRLTFGANSNNNRNSTFWLADGRYLRLKNADISYRWHDKFFSKMGIQSVTLQLVGDNLACWDKVKLWDPGQASSNGAAYPLQRIYTFQVTVTF